MSLDDIRVHVRFKLAGLWTSVMFLYVYGDIFWLYAPGKLQEMLAGKIAPFGPVTEGILLGVSASMTIPALMIFLSLVLPASVCRWTNIVAGVLYTLFVAVTMPGAMVFYLFLGTVDMIVTALVVWYAWRWPRREPA